MIADAFSRFMDGLLSIKDKSKMETFLNEILTEKERVDLAYRWLLLEQLQQHRPQREIAAKYHLSLCKITRGARLLKNENSIVKKIIESEEKK
jgi:TrpR family trp operon transcriptional repressor